MAGYFFVLLTTDRKTTKIMEHPIFQKIETSKKVDFGDILTNSYNLFLKVWQQGAMHTLIMMLFVIPFIVLVYVPVIYMSYASNRYYDPYYYDYSPDYGMAGDNWLPFMIIYFIVLFVLIIIMQSVSLGVMAHFYKVCRIVDMETGEDEGGYFDYFKNGGFMKVFVLSLATFGIAMAAILLCYLPIFYVMVPLQLMLPIFAFNSKLSVSDIVKAAFKLGHKHWIYVFGLILIAGNVAQLGILVCIIGIIFTACIAYLPIYYFYKDTVGFDDAPVPETALTE
jgi:hypothetical protein